MKKLSWFALLLGLTCAAATEAASGDSLLGCRKLTMKALAVDATLARISWSCPTPASPLPLPIPNPFSGVYGTLVLSAPDGNPIYAGLFLSSSGWRRLGPAAAPKGYRFSGFVNGVDHLQRCVVTLLPKGIKARCLGPVNHAFPVAGPVSVMLATVGDTEPFRLSRRLLTLRGWGHGTSQQVRTGGARARGKDGAHAPG